MKNQSLPLAPSHIRFLIPSGTTASEVDRKSLLNSGKQASRTARTRWTWSCRSLLGKRLFQELALEETPLLRAGDVVIAEVRKVGQIAHVRTKTNALLRLHTGDLVIGVIGQQERSGKRAPNTNNTSFELWSEEGLIGRLPDALEHTPTRVVLRGILGDETSQRINLKNLFFEPSRNRISLPPVFLMVGTEAEPAMIERTAGLVDHLAERNVPTSVCRITGAMSSHDFDEMVSSSATSVRDLAEYGFPSTRGSRAVEVAQLFYTLLTDASIPRPKVIIGQLSDGILNTESRVVLSEASSLPAAVGVVLSASSALAAAQGIELLEQLDEPIVAIVNTGDNGPIGTELEGIRPDIPVIESDPEGQRLASVLVSYIETRKRTQKNVRRMTTLRRVEGCGPSSPDRRAA
jgi:hypothetical protein